MCMCVCGGWWLGVCGWVGVWVFVCVNIQPMCPKLIFLLHFRKLLKHGSYLLMLQLHSCLIFTSNVVLKLRYETYALKIDPLLPVTKSLLTTCITSVYAALTQTFLLKIHALY